MDPSAAGNERGDQVRDPLGASGLTASQSPSTAAGPKAAAIVRPASARSVTRRRTPSMATTSSSGPAAIERPWWRMTTRSHTRSTSVSRCELRMTVAPRSRAARMIGPDVGPAERVERRGRLVEEDELRIPEQRDAQPEPLLHPLREAAHGVVGTIGQADPVERLVDDSPSIGGGDPAEPRMEREDLAGVQPGLVAEELGQVADPCPRGAVAERRAEHATAARRRPGHAEQELDRGRLAGAVGTEQPDDLATADDQVEPGQGRRRSVRLDDPVELDHGS